MSEGKEFPIINTVKGRKGKEPVFIPVDSEGNPLTSKKDENLYDKKGRKTRLPLKGEIVDTEA